MCEYYQNKNNIPTPITVTKAPNISFVFTFSLNIIIDTGIIVTGTIEVIVEVIPAEVYCKANKDRETPTNGPNIAPNVIPPIAFLSFMDFLKSSHLLRYINNIVKLINPAIILIWVEAKTL